MEQHKERTLDQDFLLSWNSVSAKQGHFGASTEYLAAQRQVVNKTWGAKRRLFGLLPPKAFQTGPHYLAVPEEITTEAELIRFVKRERPGWIRRH